MNRIKTKAYLEVTLEQAREWYESGNEDLKKLALTAFSEEMLIPSFKEIVESEEDYGFWNTLVCPPSMTEQLSSLASLQIVANYLNKGWIKTEGNTGYFLGRGSSLSGKTETDIKGVYVVMHQNVKYPGIVYFRTVADAQKAVKPVTQIPTLTDAQLQALLKLELPRLEANLKAIDENKLNATQVQRLAIVNKIKELTQINK